MRFSAVLAVGRRPQTIPEKNGDVDSLQPVKQQSRDLALWLLRRHHLQLSSTPTRLACQGDRAWCEYHTHLMHTPFTHLHAGTVAALACAMSHTRIAASDAITQSHRHVTVNLSLSVFDMPTVQEGSSASHKCHSRVRRFGRVFNLPYKRPWMWVLRCCAR